MFAALYLIGYVKQEQVIPLSYQDKHPLRGVRHPADLYVFSPKSQVLFQVLRTHSFSISPILQNEKNGAVSDLLMFISDLARFNEVKSLNVSLRIPGVIKMHFCKFISGLK